MLDNKHATCRTHVRSPYKLYYDRVPWSASRDFEKCGRRSEEHQQKIFSRALRRAVCSAILCCSSIWSKESAICISSSAMEFLLNEPQLNLLVEWSKGNVEICFEGFSGTTNFCVLILDYTCRARWPRRGFL